MLREGPSSQMDHCDGQQKPLIPPIWPVKLGTNLTRLEIFALENAGFQLPPKERITPTRLFTNSAPPLDMSRIRIPDDLDSIPTRRLSKAIRRSNSTPSAKQRQMVASTEAMQAIVLKLTMIPSIGIWLCYHSAIQARIGTSHLPGHRELLPGVQLRKLQRYNF